MAVIIYGRRAYGRVHAHEGEYADTQFAHIDFLPLFPISSFWVTQDLGTGQRQGIPIKLHGKSVAATYLRVWAPPIAIGLIATGNVIAAIVGLALAAMSAWSWTWRSLRGEAAKRRSDFNRVTWGSRCEPRWMQRETREKIASSFRDGLGKRDDARPPEDVARFGPRDVHEALYAYGMLRFAGDRTSDSAADRLLTAAFEPVSEEGGPYREGASRSADAVGAEIAELAAKHAAADREARKPYEERRRKRWFRRPGVQLVGLVLATPTLAAAAAMIAMNVAAPTHLTGAQLDGMVKAPHERASVTCDRIQDDGWAVVGGSSEEHIAFCWMGKHALPIVSKGDELPAARENVTLVGKLRAIPDQATGATAIWLGELRSDPVLDARTFQFYLVRDSSDRWVSLVFAILFAGLTITGWVFWIRAFVSRRAARRAGSRT